MNARVYTLTRDTADLAMWRLVATLPCEEGRQLDTLLSVWFDEEQPPYGTYRCEGPNGRAVILPWTGA